MAAGQYDPPIGTRPQLEWVELARLRIDADYQRTLAEEKSRAPLAGNGPG